MNLVYVQVPVVYRVKGEYGMCILVAALQEYVSTYSTPRALAGSLLLVARV